MLSLLLVKIVNKLKNRLWGDRLLDVYWDLDNFLYLNRNFSGCLNLNRNLDDFFYVDWDLYYFLYWNLNLYRHFNEYFNRHLNLNNHLYRHLNKYLNRHLYSLLYFNIYYSLYLNRNDLLDLDEDLNGNFNHILDLYLTVLQNYRQSLFLFRLWTIL